MIATIGLTIAGCGGGPASGTGGAGGGASCATVSQTPIWMHPFRRVDCTALSAMTTKGHPLEVARIPGWMEPILVDQVTIPAASNALDGGCTLESNHTIFVAVGGDTPPASSAAWTEVQFNPQIAPIAMENVLSDVVVSIPPQLVKPGQNLYVAIKTQGDQGRFCFGYCDQQAEDWTWAGSDLGGLSAVSYQSGVYASGEVQRACEGWLHDNVDQCPKEQVSSISAAPTEDGDLVVERLVPTTDVDVNEIEFQMFESSACPVPSEVELIYFVGSADAPQGSTFNEAKVPSAGTYRVGDVGLLLTHKVDPPLHVPAGKALYAGIRQHPSATCIETCAGPGAMPGDAWWGHTHKTPGQVVWASLASEGFLRSLQLSAFYVAK
jgi:hypothetical protein